MKNIKYNDLYILATPIGNLNEANNLLKEKLESLSTIFCEDTRITKNLLNLLNIKNCPNLISFHKFNEKEKLNIALEYLKQNDCGLISDAGYPTISDPGYNLVQLCHKEQIKVNIVNGSCAINHALAQSGFCSNGFIFIGFIPKKNNEAIQIINETLYLKLPIVFFVSVHQISQTILLLKQYYSDYEIYIGRELTKKFESYYVGLVKNISLDILKGEFCFILKPKNNKDKLLLPDLENDLKLMLKCNIKLNDACKYLAKKYDISKTDLYSRYMNKK